MTARPGVQVGPRQAFMPASWNGYGRLPAGWSDSAPPGTSPLSVGVIGYDNWWKGAETHVPEIGNAGTLRASFQHRQPLAYEPNFYSSDPTLATISLVREQQIADQWIQDCAAAGITYIARLWYPLTSQQDLINHPDEAGHENLMRAHARYKASAYKSQLQWCWIAQSVWMRDPATALIRINYMLSEIDEQYLRAFPSRPVFYCFNYGGPFWDATYVTILRNACKAAGYGNPYLIAQTATTTTDAALVTAGFDARCAYGPLDISIGAGQQSWASIAAVDVSRTQFVNANLNAVPHLSGGTDQRPISGTGWSDPPTITQWVARMQAVKAFVDANPANCPHNTCLIYSMNELAERGGIMATAQNDVNGTGRGYYLDGIAHALGKTVLTTSWDSFTPINLTHCTRSGAGWSSIGGIAGAFQSSRLQSTTATDYVEATRVTAASGVFNVYGTKGPDIGIANVQLDGGAATPVDMYAAVSAENQLIMSYTGLSAASHVVRVTVTGTKNASSSAAYIVVDQFKALVVMP